MITCLLTIGVLNFTIGFFLAVKFEAATYARAGEPCVEPVGQPNTADKVGEESIADVVEAEAEARLEPVSLEPLVTIPAEWVALLAAESLQANSFVEAAMHVLRLEIDKYREELVHLECYMYDTRAGNGVLASVFNKLKEVNETWLEHQDFALDHLAKRRDELGEYYEFGEQLEQVLNEQSNQIRAANEQFDEVTSITANKYLAAAKVTMCQQIHLAHRLRDRIQQSLMVIFRNENRLDGFDRKLHFDSLTGFHNLHGLEVLFREWRRDETNRLKQLSIGLVDLDEFGKVNERFGNRAGDEVLVKFSEVISELNESGAAIARSNGAAFCFFFGDCDSQIATNKIETVRQSLMGATFELEGEKIQLTASCGVSEVMPNDEVDWVYKRIRKAITQAQVNGGNRTYKSEGAELSPTNAPDLQVQKRIVQVR